jgi:hypothetical protein
MPKELADFVDEVVGSFVAWDLLIGFAKKPDVSGTSATFGTLLGRPAADLTATLHALSDKGLLTRQAIAGQENFFALNPDSPLLPTLRLFAAYNESQENRLKVLSRILRHGVQG